MLLLVYEELRKLAAAKLAQEKPGQTLQSTAIVHEAYMRLLGNADQNWNSRGHFSAAADEDRLALVEALSRLSEEKQECADIVKLRFFGGLSLRDAGAALGISSSTADRYWAYARAWLFDALRDY